MIYVREIPIGEEVGIKVNELRVVAHGNTHEECLGSLIIAINEDTVDDINNFLIITQDE